MCYFHFTIQGSTGLSPHKIRFLHPSFFFISSVFISSAYNIHTYSILKFNLTPLHPWLWKSALSWPSYLGPCYFLRRITMTVQSYFHTNQCYHTCIKYIIDMHANTGGWVLFGSEVYMYDPIYTFPIQNGLSPCAC